MDIAKFIEENKVYADDLYMGAEQVILVNDLKELLKTHSIVPNEPTVQACYSGISAYEDATGGDRLPDGEGYDEVVVAEIYKAMLKASQENNQ